MAILCGGWIRILGGFNTTFEVTVLVVPRQNGTQYFSPASEGEKEKKKKKAKKEICRTDVTGIVSNWRLLW